MVSERYRDLLLSTTQISTLHDSSLKLSRKLKEIEDGVTHPGGKEESVVNGQAGEKVERAGSGLLQEKGMGPDGSVNGKSVLRRIGSDTMNSGMSAGGLSDA